MPLAGPGTSVGYRAGGGGASDRVVQNLGVTVAATTIAATAAATAISVTVSPPSIIASGV